jgi:HEPN domain-containing protein
MNSTTRKTIEGWIDKAFSHLSVAREHAKSPYRSSEAIQSAQECVELSVKSVLSILEVRYPRAHEWPADSKAFGDIARQIRERQLLTRLDMEQLAHTVRLPRLLFLLNFWSQFYLVAKYGFEAEHLASARDLFETADAVLAVEHADEAWRAASTLAHLPNDRLLLVTPAEPS